MFIIAMDKHDCTLKIYLFVQCILASGFNLFSIAAICYSS